MYQINLTDANPLSTNNTKLVNLTNIEGIVDRHMEISIYKSTCDDRTFKKTIFIFMGYEYKVSYFSSSGCVKTVTGIVTGMSGANAVVCPNGGAGNQYIILKYYPKSTTTDDGCTASVVRGIPNCILSGDRPEYNEPIEETIPIGNIVDVSYSCKPIEPPKFPERGVEVVLLGISAELCRAVVVNLRMIYDGCDIPDAIKDVNLEVGKKYTMAYYDSNSKTIYEFDGKLISIKETDRVGSAENIVREVPGICNSLYQNRENVYDAKVAYMTGEEIDHDVELVFDTSTDFSGEYHSIMLSAIRDCTYIVEDEPDEPEEPTDPEPPEEPDKIIDMISGCTVIELNADSQQVKFTNHCGTKTVPLQEIMDYYFGN